MMKKMADQQLLTTLKMHTNNEDDDGDDECPTSLGEGLMESVSGSYKDGPKDFG